MRKQSESHTLKTNVANRNNQQGYITKESLFQVMFQSALQDQESFLNPHITYMRLLLVKFLRFIGVSGTLEILEKWTGHFTAMCFIISIMTFFYIFTNFWSLHPYFRLSWSNYSFGIPGHPEKGRGFLMDIFWSLQTAEKCWASATASMIVAARLKKLGVTW